MGKGRDRRKKHEDPEKAAKRAARQAAKLQRGTAKGGVEHPEDGTNLGGLNNEEDVAVTIARLRKADMKRKRVEEVDIPHPAPRCNTMIVRHPVRDHELVTFGGEVWDGEATRPYNDLLIYNVVKKQWRMLASPGGPSPRSSCQLFTFKQYVFVHGGEFVSQTQAQFLHFRDCFRLDMNTGVWDQLSAGGKGQGPCPSARSGHRIAFWRRSAVLFGGFYDNALESRYYNDLWVLHDVEGDGRWVQVPQAEHVDAPHPRSGHAIAIHNDDLFVYGGFFSHKANRFAKAEATVFHDLWTINLSSAQPLWQKVKLAGIPPPIRAGVGFTAKDKRLVLFGGVVDIDGPGGRMMSNFTNDVFVFNMETKKFFPLLLKAKHSAKKSVSAAAAAASSSKREGGDLAAEVGAILGTHPTTGNASSDDEDDEGDGFGAGPAGQAGLTAEGLAALEEPKTSCVTISATGQTLPCPRMNTMMCFVDDRLVVYGGQYENGKKEVTLSDLYLLNINRPETFDCHYAQDLTNFAWKGAESEASGSWEDGSTVLDTNSMAAGDDEPDEEADTDDAQHSADEDGDDEEDEDDTPAANPLLQKIKAAAATGGARVAANDDDDDEVDCDARVNVKGKASLTKHKAQLQQQLAASNAVPAPISPEEPNAAFYERTSTFWLVQAAEALGKNPDEAAVLVDRRVRKEAVQYCKMRYTEATTLMRRLAEIDAQMELEKEVLRQHREAKRKAAAAAAADEDDDDAEQEECPAAVPMAEVV